MLPDPPFDALVPFGWDDRVAALYASTDPDPAIHVPGRVVRIDYDRCLVATGADDGPVQATAWPLPATGDWVRLRLTDDGPEGVGNGTPPAVDAVLPRWSALAREDQVLAANVDVVLVVASLDTPINLNRIERQLVLAWDSGAKPVVILTKADCHADPKEVVVAVEARAGRVDVVLTSSTLDSGVDEVAAHLRPNRTAVLLGPSGAGKSTLANRLLEADILATGRVRTGDHKGRHTTTSRDLVVVPAGGVLIDTPGVRSLTLAGAEDGLAAAFSDVGDLAEDCKFRDCRHDGEPGCAVTAAVRAGLLDADRVANFRKIERDLERQAPSVLERAEAAKKGKVGQKALRKFYKGGKPAN
ncbi:MAG: ribosome biosis GTPase / thiamine phosphate phosphatase [Actinomycetota bacterium]|nr:ribosome biosis GTPase / thiamine phosphate phosphatase [Actinomycetota bacterium]